VPQKVDGFYPVVHHAQIDMDLSILKRFTG
jgi:hypothetical protein